MYTGRYERSVSAGARKGERDQAEAIAPRQVETGSKREIQRMQREEKRETIQKDAHQPRESLQRLEKYLK